MQLLFPTFEYFKFSLRPFNKEPPRLSPYQLGFIIGLFVLSGIRGPIFQKINMLIMIKYFYFYSREARRIVFVPFSGESIRGTNVAQINKHIELKHIITSGELSSSFGLFISLRKKYLQSGKQDIAKNLVPFTAKLLDGAIPDIILSYSAALWFTKEVSHIETAAILF